MRIESRQQLIECREQFKKALECQSSSAAAPAVSPAAR